jgi:hypothetical protein
MQLSLMHIFYRVITLRVSLSIKPFAIAIIPSSLNGLLFKLILLNLYLFDRIAPISLAPTEVILLFSRYSERRVSFSSSALAKAIQPLSLI